MNSDALSSDDSLSAHSAPQHDVDMAYVDAAQSGDVQAFDQLVIKYSPKLYSLIYNMTSHAEDSRDLLQDVFAKAFRSLSKFRRKSSFYTWIYSIAVNICLNYLKKRKRRGGYSFDPMDESVINNETFVDLTHLSNPTMQIAVKELQKKLNIALQSLSNEHRAVVTMFDIQGIKHSQIAAIMKISEGTVRSRLFYAHQQMRVFLEEFIGE